MANVVEQIQAAVQSRYPIIYLVTAEEQRVIDALEAVAGEMSDGSVRTWTCIDGLDGDAATADPVTAINKAVREPRAGFTVFKDLSEFMDDPRVVRALRNAYHALLDRPDVHLAIVAPVSNLPETLLKEICLLQIPFPSAGEMREEIHRMEGEYGATLPEALYGTVALALRGLTVNEARHVLHRVFTSGQTGEKEVLDQVFAVKQLLLKKAGYLQFVPTHIPAEQIGGLDVLKAWALKRRSLFTQEAVEKGYPTPKGILIMGVSGCGKSMSAKAIATLWRVPLFRLDMNLVFSGVYGSPEAAFARALEAIESVAPVVLWIDEIENALGMTTEQSTPEQSLTFSSFLTWMQERPPLIFVAATANRIEALPAEVIRKGRFDEVFFCDLPTDDERREIIRIHLRLNGIDPDTIPIDRLLYSTRNWSGAEIEQAIVAGRIDADHAGRPVEFEDIRNHTVSMVPLAETMAEQIKAIRSWSFNRALRASTAAERSMIPGQ